MADNVTITSGSGTFIATNNIGGVNYQRVKTALGPAGTYTADQDGTAARGAYVDVRPNRQNFTVTPVISTSPAYTSGDCLGGLNTIANASRAASLGGEINSLTVLDKTQAQRSAFDLVFFSSQPAGTYTDNAAFAPSDADSALITAVVSVLTTDYNTAWPGTPLNSVAFKPDTKTAANPAMLQIPYFITSTSLYLVCVIRGTPTYTSTSDIVIGLNCILD